MTARHEVTAAEPEEQQSGERPGKDSETEPLGDLTQVVGAGHILVHTFLGQIMVGIPGFAQVTDDMIRMHVNDPSGEEDQRTDDETRIG